MGLREATPTTELARLADVSDRHSQELHARIDRLEIGLREIDGQRRHGVAALPPAVAPVPAPAPAPAPSAASEVQATFVNPHIDPLDDVRPEHNPFGVRRE